MSKITIRLNQVYKSFANNFQCKFDGNLIILSGVNGSGKSQLINIINGQEGSNYNTKINSQVFIDDKEIAKDLIEFQSFKENININQITNSSSQTFLDGSLQAWSAYNRDLLNPNSQNNKQFSHSCILAKDILQQNFSNDDFAGKKISQEELKRVLMKNDFIWKQGDIFSNTIGEIFFIHAIKISEKLKETGRENFDPDSFEISPWKELNDLFEELSFSYRFKSDYWIEGVEINEQPKLHPVNRNGELDIYKFRNLSDLSDGEKTIISLCFASINGKSSTKSILLLDELDAVLNPSLIQMFYVVIKRFFLNKGIIVIMATHSSASISLSPKETKYYEVFKPIFYEHRILEVDRDDYSELKIVNDRFYKKIENQQKRIEHLEGKVTSNKEILIITEGKTDWKYFIKALHFFHTRNEFLGIEKEFFYRYGSAQDVQNSICGTNEENELSESKLKNFLTSLQQTRLIDAHNNRKIRIGIFDSDTNLKVLSDKAHGIYSFKIQPNNISTEFLFSDQEIMTSIDDKRLFIGEEFHKRTKRNISDKNLSLGGDPQNINKANKRVIIDSDVYNPQGENIALTKDKFAQGIFEGTIEISQESWENFRHIFEEIQTSIA